MNTFNYNAAVYRSGPTFVAADSLRLSFVLSADNTSDYSFGGSMQKPITNKGHSHSARSQVNYTAASIT